MAFERRKILSSGMVCLMLGVGVSLSYWGSDQFRAAARDDWLNKGRAEAASMTETVMFRISKSEVNLRTIVGQIQGLQSFDPGESHERHGVSI